MRWRAKRFSLCGWARTWRARGSSSKITRWMLRIWTCSETRSPVFRPHDASALDSIDVLGLQHTLLVQRAFGRNGNPLIENRASLGVDGGRRVRLHDFPVAGFQRKLRAVDLVNDAANQVLRRGGGRNLTGRGCLTPCQAGRPPSADERPRQNQCWNPCWNPKSFHHIPPSVKSKNTKLLVAGDKDAAVRHHGCDVGVGVVARSKPAARRAVKKLLQGAARGLPLEGPQTNGRRAQRRARGVRPRDGPDNRIG